MHPKTKEKFTGEKEPGKDREGMATPPMMNQWFFWVLSVLASDWGTCLSGMEDVTWTEKVI